jgi:hypothetical protein
MSAPTGEEGGLTQPGYWAMLHGAGIERLYRIPGSLNWMAKDSNGMIFPVRDPTDLSPEQRAERAEETISLNVGPRH